jgi:hypothetical protein
MAGLEVEPMTDTDLGEIVGWRLKELKLAGYDETAALAIATVAILILVVWGVRKWLRRRRTTVAQLRTNANCG